MFSKNVMSVGTVALNMFAALLFVATHARSSALPRGVVSVVEFGADPSGSKDSTKALQLALDSSRKLLHIVCYCVLCCHRGR